MHSDGLPKCEIPRDQSPLTLENRMVNNAGTGVQSRPERYTRCPRTHGISSCEYWYLCHSCARADPWRPGLLVHVDTLNSAFRHRRVNSRSVFLGCKFAIAQFLSQPVHRSGHRGWIINTASMLGLVGLKPSAGAYCASKGAAVLLTKQIAVEYALDKIHCNALCPGCKSKSPNRLGLDI